MTAGLIAPLATGTAVAAITLMVARPRRRLAARVRPYTSAARASLGTPIDPGRSGGSVRAVLVEPVERLTAAVMKRSKAASDHDLALRLERAGLFADLPADRRVAEYRLRVVGTTVGLGLGGLALALALPMSAAGVLLVGTLGAVAGATRWRGRVDRAIEVRRERLRVELYTVAQLLALTIRVGGGVIQALQRVTERGHGLLVDEMREILRRHTAGTPIAEALQQASEVTAEPFVARMYRLLATGVSHGADLGTALLAHSEEVRAARREALRRAAVRRRAAMLVPIVAVLAPVMLLFVAAPLPSLVFGFR